MNDLHVETTFPLVPLKHLVNPMRPITYGIVQCGPNFEGGVPYIRPADMEDESGVSNTEKLLRTDPRIAFDYRRSTVRPNDLVLSIGPSFGKVMVVPNELDGANLTQGTARVAPASNRDARFMFWALRSSLCNQQWESRVSGATFRALNLGPLGDTLVPDPSYSQQKAIAAFLDGVTSRLDVLLGKKKELIERLNERRIALISRCVTRGLPSAYARAARVPENPPLKASGVEWIGEIPKHWTLMKVKFVAKMESGHTPSRSEPTNWIEDECVIPWVSLNDTKFLKDNDFIGDTAVKISEEGMKNSSAHLLPPGVVVFTRDATIGLTAVTTCPAAVSQHIIAWVPGPKITTAYLLFSFKAMQQYLESFTFGSTLKTIGMTDIRKLVIPLPPLPEQAAIAAYLETATAKIDALIRKVEEAIERLHEYRAALITAAVTGKIDVRKAAS